MNEHPVAVITGATRRIGAEIARHLHHFGFDLMLHHRGGADEGLLLRAELEEQRADSVALWHGDLADVDRLPQLVEATIGRYGRIDALVNNASSFRPTPIGTVTPADWNALFASNAQGPLFLSQAAASALRDSGGSIVNLLDVYAERPLAGHTVYCMAKAALSMLTRSLAFELAPTVRVNAVAPGAILWPEHQVAGQLQKSEAQKTELLARVPLARTGDPHEVAEAVRWLIMDARYTTGQTIRVDGGRSLTI